VIAILLVLGATVLLVRKTVDVIGIMPKRPVPMGPGLLYTIVPLCTVTVYHPIRRRMAMYAYVSWLKSFEEPQVRRRKSWRLVDIWGRFGLKSTRSVTPVSIRLPLRGRGRGNTVTELQGPE
jgi:hypothetical protein